MMRQPHQNPVTHMIFFSIRVIACFCFVFENRTLDYQVVPLDNTLRYYALADSRNDPIASRLRAYCAIAHLPAKLALDISLKF